MWKQLPPFVWLSFLRSYLLHIHAPSPHFSSLPLIFLHCRGENNVYECTICNVFVTSHEQFTTHIEGIKHQTKLRQVEGKECALKPLAHRKSRGTLRGRVAHGSGRGGMQLDRGACILSLNKFFPHENAVNQKVHTVTAVIFFRDCRYLGRWYPGKVMCCAYFFYYFWVPFSSV